MSELQFIKLREQPQLKEEAANWFHTKWNVPLSAYLESIDDCLVGKAAVPQWYVVTADNKLIAGLGVIENDFHPRKDLAPNVCAVYVDKAYRNRGIAGKLLNLTVEDMKKQGINTLYLVTSHTGFYERYGWRYFCSVICDGEDVPSKVYVLTSL